MFITHRKDLLIGDYLIDDRLANGAKDFKGKLLRLGYDYEKKYGMNIEIEIQLLNIYYKNYEKIN